MIIKSASFITSATEPSQYPDPGLPEIAFAGKSNVGKSSMINILVNRKRLVKTSSTPGRTRLLNFFNINESFIFTDLPGFGYAKVPKSVQKQWGPMIETYLLTRTTLKGVVVILDLRRIPGNHEIDLLAWLEHNNIKFCIILTKSDKLSKTKQKKQFDLITQALCIDKNKLIMFSAKTRKGKENVWRAVNDLIYQKNLM